MQLLPLKEKTQTLHVCRLIFLKVTSAALEKTFARFQADLSSCEGFHRVSKILTTAIAFFRVFLYFHGFQAWMSKTRQNGKTRLAAHIEPLLDSILASCPLKTFIELRQNLRFSGCSEISMDFDGFS